MLLLLHWDYINALGNPFQKLISLLACLQNVKNSENREHLSLEWSPTARHRCEFGLGRIGPIPIGHYRVLYKKEPYLAPYRAALFAVRAEPTLLPAMTQAGLVHVDFQC